MKLWSAIWLARIPVLGFLAIGMFWGAFAAAVPDLKAGLGASDQTFGLLLLFNAAGLAIAMITAPWIDGQLGKRSLQVAVLAYACAMLVPAGVSTLMLFGFAMMGMGITSGLLDVLINTRVSELESASGRSLMNAAHGMFSVAYALSAFVMGLVRSAGVDPLWQFAGIAILLCVFAVCMAMTPAGTDGETPTKGWLGWGVLLCGLIVLVAFMTEATVEAWSALHIERTLGGAAAEGALGPTMLGITMAVGRLGGQTIIERTSPVTLMVCATTLALAGTILAALAPTPFWAYMGFGIMGLGVSVTGPIGLALVGQRTTAKDRSKAIAQASLLGFSGFFFAPAAMGVIAEATNLRVAYLCVAILVLTLYPLIWAVKKP